MGKVRRLRQKYHQSCQKSEKQPTTSPSTPIAPVVFSVPGEPVPPIKLPTDSNLFAGVKISLSDLKQSLLPPSREILGSTSLEATVVSSKIKKDLKHLPKKEKRRYVRESLLERLGAVRKPAAKQHRKRVKKTALNIDLKSLVDSLPAVVPKEDKESQHHGSNGKQKKFKKAKASKLQFLSDVKAFKSVLSNSYYKADPASAISNYTTRTAHKQMNIRTL